MGHQAPREKRETSQQTNWRTRRLSFHRQPVQTSQVVFFKWYLAVIHTHPRYYFTTKHYQSLRKKGQVFTPNIYFREGDKKCQVRHLWKIQNQGQLFLSGSKIHPFYLRESALVSPLPNSACLTNGVMSKKRKGGPGETKCWGSDPAQTFNMQWGFLVFTTSWFFLLTSSDPCNFPSVQRRHVYVLSVLAG